jgi:iron complex transport system ATP-binding protein
MAKKSYKSFSAFKAIFRKDLESALISASSKPSNTYLDLTHQIEVLDLLYKLNQEENRTIVMVLHDINLACRYATNIVALVNKGIYAQGKPKDIITGKLVQGVFQLNCEIIEDPIYKTPMCIPYGNIK